MNNGAPPGWHTITPRIVVEDADAAFPRALEAGALAVEPVWNTPYGDRRGMVRDPWGNVWQVATRMR